MRLKSTANRANGVDRSVVEVTGVQPFLLPEGSSGDIDPLVVAASNLNDPYVVKVRAIRAKIAASLGEQEGDRGQKLIALVGIGADEEVSILSANLGVMEAQLRLSTVLVDGGLNHPTLHVLFRVPNEFGVSSALADEAAEPAMEPTAIPSLYVVPAGLRSDISVNYLQGQSLAQAISRWRLSEDRIIVNLPAMDMAIEALGTVLEGFDSVVLVSRRDETAIRDIRRAIDSLDAKAVPIAGSVIG